MSQINSSRSIQTAHQPALGFRVWRVAQRELMRHAHTHPDIEINCLQAGVVNYAIGGKLVKILAGEMALFWGGVPHQLIAGNQFPGIWLTIPLAWFLRCGFSNFFAGRVMGGRLIKLPMAIDRAEQWLDDFEAGAPRRNLVLLELQAICERIALLQLRTRAKQKPSEIPTLDGLNHIERALAFLASRYQQPLAIEDIADELNLHPKYLMTIFRKANGITISAYITRLRLAHAQTLLATTQTKVLDIALESGFGSLGRFYEVFHQLVGMRPLQFRQQQT